MTRIVTILIKALSKELNAEVTPLLVYLYPAAKAPA